MTNERRKPVLYHIDIDSFCLPQARTQFIPFRVDKGWYNANWYEDSADDMASFRDGVPRQVQRHVENWFSYLSGKLTALAWKAGSAFAGQSRAASARHTPMPGCTTSALTTGVQAGLAGRGVGLAAAKPQA